MTPEDRKAVSRCLLSLWTSNSKESFDAIFTFDYRNHHEGDVSGIATPRSLEQYKVLLAGYHAAFSSCTVEIFAQIAEGKLVATRWQLTATQTGTYVVEPHTLEPTNKTSSWTGIELDRFDGGKIAESWVPWDKFGFYAALGLV